VKRRNVSTIALLQLPSGSLRAESIVLAGLHTQDEIKASCEGAGGQYFEDVEFGIYGCTNEGRGYALYCAVSTLKCSMRLPDSERLGVSLRVR
jgi:hypothetical protein